MEHSLEKTARTLFPTISKLTPLGRVHPTRSAGIRPHWEGKINCQALVFAQRDILHSLTICSSQLSPTFAFTFSFQSIHSLAHFHYFHYFCSKRLPHSFVGLLLYNFEQNGLSYCYTCCFALCCQWTCCSETSCRFFLLHSYRVSIWGGFTSHCQHHIWISSRCAVSLLPKPRDDLKFEFYCSLIEYN